MSSNQPPVVGTVEAAKILGVDVATVRRYCIQGRLPGAYKVSRDWSIPRESLEHFAKPPLGRRPLKEHEEHDPERDDTPHV